MTGQFELTDDQRAMQDVARRFTTEQIAPFAAEWDERHIFPKDVIRQAAALGVAAL